MTVSQAYDKYSYEVLTLGGFTIKTKTNYETSKRSCIHAVGDKPIEYLQPADIITWKQYMSERSLRPSTQNTNLYRLRMVLMYLEECGVPVMNPAIIKPVKGYKDLPRYLEHHEVKSMVAAAKNSRDKALIALMYSTGCRLNEIRMLNIQDIQYDEIVIHGKGNKYRTVFLTHRVRALLYVYLQGRTDTDTCLFISEMGKRISLSRIDQILKTCARDAGITKRVSPHVMRHSFATSMAKQGTPLSELKELLGHEYISTTMMYVHYSKHYLKGVYKQYHKDLDI